MSTISNKDTNLQNKINYFIYDEIWIGVKNGKEIVRDVQRFQRVKQSYTFRVQSWEFEKKCRRGREDFLLNLGCRVENHLNTRWDKWELKGLKLKDCKIVRMTLNQKF